MDTRRSLSTALTRAHGGTLVDLLAGPDEAKALTAASVRFASWDLTPRQLCDLELIMTGAFSPLRGFMTRRDYESVCRDMRLADGTMWPIPVVLDIPEDVARRLGPGDPVALREPEGVLLGVLKVEDVWQPDRVAEAESIYGTTTTKHPGVRRLLEETHPWFVGGTIQALQRPTHYDFRPLRETPAQLQEEFARRGWNQVVAFQTRNPMHRAHVELTRCALQAIKGGLLIHPVVGMTKPGDVDHYTRVRCYQAVLSRYDQGTAKLALLPLAMRMAGPREAVWHAIIRKNYGCTHLIVGRDHAGPGLDPSGRPFYSPYAAQELLRDHQEELGISMVPFREMAYVAENDRYYPEDQLPQGAVVSSISGTELRRRLATGDAIPEWFSYPEVIEQLRVTHPPRAEQGVTIFFTGLSGAGKSTIANVLRIRLLEEGSRPVTLLDGDLVRKHLSSELGFSKEHRDLNIRRIGFVAAEITTMRRDRDLRPNRALQRHPARSPRDDRARAAGSCSCTSRPRSKCASSAIARDSTRRHAQGIVRTFTGISDPTRPRTTPRSQLTRRRSAPKRRRSPFISRSLLAGTWPSAPERSAR